VMLMRDLCYPKPRGQRSRVTLVQRAWDGYSVRGVGRART